MWYKYSGSHFLNYYNNRSTERNKKDFFFFFWVWQAIKCTMVQQNEWVPVQKGNFLCTRRLTAEIMEPFTNIFFCVANNKIVGQWSLLKCIINKEINRKKKRKKRNKIPSSGSWLNQLENICKGWSFASLCVPQRPLMLTGWSLFWTL